MMKMNLQLFAHKKGVGSTKNGRDSESKRLRCEESRRTVCIKPATSFTDSAELRSIQA